MIDETWSVCAARVRQFFLQQADVSQTAQGFSYRSCCITLRELPPGGAGMFSLPRTRIRIWGDEADESAIYRRFYLRFLSAGG